MGNSYVNGAIKGLLSDEILAILGERFAIKMLKKDNFGPAKLYEFSEIRRESKNPSALACGNFKLSPVLAEGGFMGVDY